MSYKIRTTFCVLLTVVLFISCSSNITSQVSDPSDTTTENVTDTPEVTEYFAYADPDPYIVENAPISESAIEITLPKEGETLKYDPPLTLYTTSRNETFSVVSASLQGGKLTLYTNESEYYFNGPPIGICDFRYSTLHHLSSKLGDDGKWTYETYPGNTFDAQRNRLSQIIGSRLDETKAYAIVSNHYTIQYTDRDYLSKEEIFNTVTELALPKDGETITYPKGFVLARSGDNETLEPVSATRKGDKLIFATTEKDYAFEYMRGFILSENKEAFVPAICNYTNDGVEYIFKLWQPYRDTAISTLKQLTDTTYDANKCYIFGLKLSVYYYDR